MNAILFRIGGLVVTLEAAAVAAAASALLLLAFVAWRVARAERARREEAERAAERQREFDLRIRELANANAELSGRLAAVASNAGQREADLSRTLAERLDALGFRVGQGLESGARATNESLGKLNERLAVIDAAQTKLNEITGQVGSLKEILSNKQQRGAFGQVRMEAIVRDGLPPDAYDFQFTLRTGARPDCVVRLPNDPRVLAIDSKFPLEAFSAFRDAKDDDARRAAQARVRADLQRHLKAIAENYLVPGETQDIAILFLPSESLYADLVEAFDDLVQRANRARVVIVSPTLLMLAIQVIQSLMRDARMREQAHVVQDEVRKLSDDVRRLQERVGALAKHYRLGQDALDQIAVSADKIVRRAERIDQVDLEPPVAAVEAVSPALKLAARND
ncbi:MAG: DNA recombination protein RmuC [Hyphomicrobiales bacterium]|nr:DNA recombination protein RmuC [Hyphomicrobiales bacterium]MDE2016132.1 DNA recombination protein RmuC [Hyphomicrobiales bacterium]